MSEQAPADPESEPGKPGLLDRAWIEGLKAMTAAPGAAKTLAGGGLAYVQSTLGSLRLFTSTRVDTAAGNPAQDETHYFLIPTPAGFALAERRRLPDGVGTLNSLPKVRIFHLHDQAALAVLEDRLRGAAVAARTQEPGWDGDLARRLEAIGEEIDRQGFWVTGGLVVIGGVVAVANPLLGIGIAAKALLPGLGGKLAKHGFGAAAESLRRLGGAWRGRSARRQAAAEVRRMQPQVAIDPVLAFVDRQVALGAKADPQLDEIERLPEWWRDRDRRLTMAVLVDVLAPDDPWPAWSASVRARLAAIDA